MGVSTVMKRVPFPLSLDVRWLDGESWLVIALFIYITRNSEQIEVHAGFVTDFASTPRWVWIIFPKSGSYGTSALIHDFLNAYPNGRTRAEIDDVFRDAMKDAGVNWLTRNLFHRAVRLGGGGAWARERAEDARLHAAG